jgi:hypothetical protein
MRGSCSDDFNGSLVIPPRSGSDTFRSGTRPTSTGAAALTAARCSKSGTLAMPPSKRPYEVVGPRLDEAKARAREIHGAERTPTNVRMTSADAAAITEKF